MRERRPRRFAAASSDTSDGGLPTLTLRAPSTYGVWLAAARHSEFRTRTGVPGYRDFYLASARFGWQLGDASRPVSVSYFVDVIPAALSTDMPEYQWNARCQPTTYCPGCDADPAQRVWIRACRRSAGRVAMGNGPARLTIEATGGGLWFSRRMPDPVATRFNFTASAGPTLELRLTPSDRCASGYLWHHTSNGGTGQVNPGLNSGILTAGVLWRARRAR